MPPPPSEEPAEPAAEQPERPAEPAAEQPGNPAEPSAEQPERTGEPVATDQPTRLHPAAIVLWPSASGLAALAAAIVAGQLAVAPVLLAAAGLGGAASVVRYLRFRWWRSGDALIIHEGVLQTQRRVIPRPRVQSVDVVRNIGHRVFGLVELRVELIGGGGGEGRLEALTPGDAEWLRQWLLSGEASTSQTAAEPGGDEELVAHLSTGELVAAGLTGGRVGVVAVGLGAAQNILGPDLAPWVERLQGSLTATALVTLGVATLVVAFLVSLAATAVTYWGFTVTRTEGALRVQRGLLEQRTDTVPLHRVQAVHCEENVVRRWLGLAAVKVDVAGRAGGDEGQKTSVLLPVGARSEALAVMDRALDAPGLAGAELAPMPVAARSRRLVRAAIATVVAVAAAVGALVAVGVSPVTLLVGAGLATAVVAGSSGWLALASYAALGHARAGAAVLGRRGVFVRRTSFVPERAIQSLAVTTTPLQRRRGLATAELQIARPPSGREPRLVDLAAGDAWGALHTLGRPGHPSTVVGEGFEPSKA